MKIYIYSYVNKQNGHRYIGKTNNIERRKREHKSMAYNEKSGYYNSLWAKKIRQYGYENFDFEILEVTDDNHWIEREQYWIAFYNTFYGIGYNTTKGGESGSCECLLDGDEIDVIYDLLINSNIAQERIANDYKVSQTLISNINMGLRYGRDGYSYPLRKNYKTLSDWQDIINLLLSTTKTFKEIARECNCCESLVKKINYGKIHYDENLSYPIRKINSFNSKYLMIRELLIETDYEQTKIAEICKCNVSTVRRINIGETHYNPKDSYPLRK